MIDWATITLKELAGYLSEELRKRGIDTILVGGACATIYSNNRYQSHDLDYITYEDMKIVKKALKELGFVEKQKYFYHKDCPWLIEFVSPPVAVGDQPIREFNKVKTALGVIKMLRPVDSVKDRLASFYHWNDKQGLEQAMNICLEQEIDLGELERWSLQENQSEKFKIFAARFKQIKKNE